MKIEIISDPSTEMLSNLNVEEWPIWEAQISEFPWEYDLTEKCYVLAGSVVVTPENGDPVTIKKGDFVTFPKGMKCAWNITADIRKHYTFDEDE